MSHEPQIQRRAAQPYVAVPVRVTMDDLPGAVDQGFGELFGWLAEHGVAPAGPPFIRYLVVDMAGELQIELAVPAEAEPPDGDRVRSGVLPAGRYVVLRHTGPYDGLVASNTALRQWAEDHGVALDAWEAAGGVGWRSRAEHYLTNPAEEPDPARWEVDVAYLTRAGDAD
jgi:effector-binding domain-containing protein